MTSSSSGHSSDDRWYEILESTDYDHKTSTPPPLPARVNYTPKRELIPHSASQHNVHNHTHNKIQVRKKFFLFSSF